MEGDKIKSSSVALIVAFLALIVGGGLYFYSGEEELLDKQIYDDGIYLFASEMLCLFGVVCQLLNRISLFLIIADISGMTLFTS